MLRLKKSFFCESKGGKGRYANEKELGRMGNRGSSGVNFRRWPAKGKTGVSHRRPPRHLPFEGRTANVFAKTRPGGEKKSRELEEARRGTKRRS